MANKDLIKKPKAGKGDIVHTGAKAVLSLVP